MKKVTLLGLAGSGKSNFLSRVTKNSFSLNYKPTIGEEFGTKTLFVADKKIIFQVWDVAGQKRLQNITQNYLLGAHLIVFFIDLQRVQESIDDIASQNLHEDVKENTKFAVVFTKSDLVQENMPTGKEFRDYTQQAFAVAGVTNEQILTKMYFVTSAKDGAGIEEAFQHWGECLMPTVIPRLVLSAPKKNDGIFGLWPGDSSESEDDDNEPLVTNFDF